MIRKECLDKGKEALKVYEQTKKAYTSLIEDRDPDQLRFLAEYRISSIPTKSVVLDIADTLEKDNFDEAIKKAERLLNLNLNFIFDTVAECECKPKK